MEGLEATEQEVAARGLEAKLEVDKPLGKGQVRPWKGRQEGRLLTVEHPSSPACPPAHLPSTPLPLSPCSTHASLYSTLSTPSLPLSLPPAGTW